MSLLATLALILGGTALAGTAHGIGSGSIGTGTKGTAPVKKSGWGSNIANFFGADTDVSDSELGKWFKETYSGNASDYINSLDDATLGALLEQYYDEENMFLGGKKHTFDYKDAVSNLEELINSVNNIDMPAAPDYNALYNNAKDIIDAENKELYAMLDQNKATQLEGLKNINSLLDTNLSRQTSNYQNEMSNLNQSYNDYARQVLSNDYIKNQQLMGSVSSALSKSKQNALEAGASAGSRIAGNINTILGIQNKQAQQSLETSNQLAQAMLNQRQAAAGIRGNYNAMLSSDTQSRIGAQQNYNNLLNSDAMSRMGIKQGSTARQLDMARNQFDVQNQIYNNQMGRYEDAMSQYQSNPFYGSYQSYQSNKRYKNNQGY